MAPPPLAGSLSVPSSASGSPCSARATLSTAAPVPVATSRYRASGVSVSPSAGAVAGTRMALTGTGASDEPIRYTSTEEPSAANAHRPSGVTTMPNGLVPRSVNMAVRTPVSGGSRAEAVLQPGADTELTTNDAELAVGPEQPAHADHRECRHDARAHDP